LEVSFELLILEIEEYAELKLPDDDLVRKDRNRSWHILSIILTLTLTPQDYCYWSSE